jgi:hypothetical protein
MRRNRTVVSTAHAALILVTVALAGCATGAHVYDYPQGGYYGGYGYYLAVPPGYFADPGYYGWPGYYGLYAYPPPVAYYDRDRHPDADDRGQPAGGSPSFTARLRR